MGRILSVGLTGGIASGKSVVAHRMAQRGAVVIDADLLAREVVAPGSQGLAEIVAAFGEEILDAGGALDRPALGKLVFDDDDARATLNAIIHPKVREKAARHRQEATDGSIVVEDIPLLVETGQQDRFDVVVVVQAPRQERIRRMTRDRGMTVEDAEARLQAQASDEERAAAADVILDNSATLEDLQRQVDELMVNLAERAAAGE